MAGLLDIATDGFLDGFNRMLLIARDCMERRWFIFMNGVHVGLDEQCQIVPGVYESCTYLDICSYAPARFRINKRH